VFLTLKMALGRLLVPPGSLLLLAVVGIWLIARRAGGGAHRAGWALLASGILLLWLLATPIVADKLTRFAQHYPALDLSQPTSAQAIVILGGGRPAPAAPEYGGEPAPHGELLERLEYGAYVAHHTGLPVLVSGTDVETLAMRASLARDFGITVRWVENRSRDTFQNAQFSAAMLRGAGVTRIILVTDADHEWRAAHEFAGAGFTVIPAPAGLYARHYHRVVLAYLPTAAALEDSSRALHEILGEPVRRAGAALGLRRHTS
jgi:uncharacterized SAM-binding protein YcdF (DUF218 family)